MNRFSSTGRHRPASAQQHSARPSAPRESITETTDGTLVRALKGALISLPVSMPLGFALLLVAAGIAYARPDPDAIMTPLSMAALGLTALAGGFTASRIARCAPVLSGLLGGGMLVLLLLVISLFFGGDTREMLTMGLSPLASVALRGGVVLLYTLGALIGAPRAKIPRHTAGHHTVRK